MPPGRKPPAPHPIPAPIDLFKALKLLIFQTCSRWPGPCSIEEAITLKGRPCSALPRNQPYPSPPMTRRPDRRAPISRRRTILLRWWISRTDSRRRSESRSPLAGDPVFGVARVSDPCVFRSLTGRRPVPRKVACQQAPTKNPRRPTRGLPGTSPDPKFPALPWADTISASR